MRWFKHFSDNHRGRSTQFLLDELGHSGPCCYNFLVEMCVEKLNQMSDRNLEDADCVFNFHQRVVRQNLRISPTNLRRLLDSCQTLGLFTFQISGDSIQISIPMLLDLLDYDNKKSRARRAKITTENRLEQNRIEQNRIELEQKGKVVALRKPKAPSVDGSQLVIAAYFSAFKNRYNSEPGRTGKAIGQLKTLAKDFGPDRASELIHGYLQMPDQWFVTKRHDVGTLLENLNSVIQFVDTGRMFTKKEIQNLDSTIHTQNMLDAVDRGEI